MWTSFDRTWINFGSFDFYRGKKIIYSNWVGILKWYCTFIIYYTIIYIHGWVWRTKSEEIFPYSVFLIFGFILQWWTRWYEYCCLRHLFSYIIYSSSKRFVYLYVEYTCQVLTSDTNKISEKEMFMHKC